MGADCTHWEPPRASPSVTCSRQPCPACSREAQQLQCAQGRAEVAVKPPPKARVRFRQPPGAMQPVRMPAPVTQFQYHNFFEIDGRQGVSCVQKKNNTNKCQID